MKLSPFLETFDRVPEFPEVCRNCGLPEGLHIWICDCCSNAIYKDDQGLPERLCCPPMGATLYCPPKELRSALALDCMPVA